MTLHKEIVQILKETGEPLTTSRISILVNQRKIYGKKDGSEVSPFQIHGRTKNYPTLFLRNKTLVGLKDRDEVIIQKVDVKDFSNENNASRQDIVNFKINTEEVVNKESNSPVHKIEFLIESGFVKLGTLSTIISNGFPKVEELKSCGIYAITKPTDYVLDYYTPEEAKVNGNVISPWSLEKLGTKWVENSDILYYGLAGANSPRLLKSRLTDLINHCKGLITDRGPHKGGEIIWQLKGYENFEIWILSTGNPPKPRQVEGKLLEQFFSVMGKLPFANKQF